MDECLIHSVFKNEKKDRYRQAEERKKNVSAETESFSIDLQGEVIRVNKRPGVDAFLRECANNFDVHIFTAATPEYADLVLDTLDPRNDIFSTRLYRSDCTFEGGMYAKDLSPFANNDDVDGLSRVVLLDNNPFSFLPQPKNGLPIESFYDDPNDVHLHNALKVFQHLDGLEDVRIWLDHTYGLEVAFQNFFNTKQTGGRHDEDGDSDGGDGSGGSGNSRL
eukprot:g5357.t1